jgi:hypothetical protein
MDLSNDMNYQSFLFTDSSRKKHVYFHPKKNEKLYSNQLNSIHSESLGSMMNSSANRDCQDRVGLTEIIDLEFMTGQGRSKDPITDILRSDSSNELPIRSPQLGKQKIKNERITDADARDKSMSSSGLKYSDNAILKNFMHSYEEMELHMKFDTDFITFFHFGCWNVDGGEVDKPLYKVISQIKTHQDNMFGIIAGDNIYKEKKFLDISTGQIVDNIPPDYDNVTNPIYFPKKIYNKKILDEGIDSLEGINRPLFACVGNHDMEECEILLDEIDRTSILMTRGQLSINTDISKWIMPHNYYNLYCETNTFLIQFIFIDTNLFIDEDDCYEHLELQRKSKLKFMLEWLHKVLQENRADKIFIVGHVYLFGFKNKTSNQFVHLNNVELLLDVLNKSPMKKIYYLCADIHNFQHVKFIGAGQYDGLDIENFTAGIGGGVPDNIPSLLNTIANTVMLNGKTIGTLELLGKAEPYGFMEYTIVKDTDPVITYFKID